MQKIDSDRSSEIVVLRGDDAVPRSAAGAGCRSHAVQENLVPPGALWVLLVFDPLLSLSNLLPQAASRNPLPRPGLCDVNKGPPLRPFLSAQVENSANLFLDVAGTSGDVAHILTDTAINQPLNH